MVHNLLCHLHPRGSRLRARDIRIAIISRRPGDSGLVLADRFLHGDVHRQLRGGAGLCVSHGRRDVLCHQTRRPSRAGANICLDPGLVQSPGSDGRGVERGIYRQSDAAGLCQHEFGSG